MSRGTKVVTFRIEPEMDAAIDLAIERRNERTKEEPWTRTDFYRAAFKEKLSHMERSRTKNRSKKNAKPKHEGIES